MLSLPSRGSSFESNSNAHTRARISQFLTRHVRMHSMTKSLSLCKPYAREASAHLLSNNINSATSTSALRKLLAHRVVKLRVELLLHQILSQVDRLPLLDLQQRARVCVVLKTKAHSKIGSMTRHTSARSRPDIPARRRRGIVFGGR